MSLIPSESHSFPELSEGLEPRSQRKRVTEKAATPEPEPESAPEAPLPPAAEQPAGNTAPIEQSPAEIQPLFEEAGINALAWENSTPLVVPEDQTPADWPWDERMPVSQPEIPPEPPREKPPPPRAAPIKRAQQQPPVARANAVPPARNSAPVMPVMPVVPDELAGIVPDYSEPEPEMEPELQPEAQFENEVAEPIAAIESIEPIEPLDTFEDDEPDYDIELWSEEVRAAKKARRNKFIRFAIFELTALALLLGAINLRIQENPAEGSFDLFYSMLVLLAAILVTIIPVLSYGLPPTLPPSRR